MKREWMGAARLGVVLFLLYLAIHYWGALSSLLLLGLGAAFPLVLGAVIAYAVNILMSLYEGWYFPDTKSPFVIKSRRPVCLLLAFASLIAIVFLLIRMILPELLECTLVLIQEVVPMLEKLSENLDLSQFFSISSTALADGSINWKEVITSITQWLVQGVGGVMGSVLSLYRRREHHFLHLSTLGQGEAGPPDLPSYEDLSEAGLVQPSGLLS